MAPPSTTPESRGSDLTNLVGLKLGNYRLERLLGRGRMGVVYLAKDEALLRSTAIKILSWSVAEAHGQDPVQWFLAEARLVARINHPRVVQIYGAARHGDHCYIAMEYVAGASAESMVARSGPMAPETATDVLLQAASALQAAHRSGVVHRDVKPANLLIGPDGVTKLGDFGMALGLTELRTGTAHLRVGTPYYTAPEIWRGEVASAASDIYSLGATYYYLLTGRTPYTGQDVAAIEQAHLRAPIPDPRELVPGLPASCSALVQRALAKAPRDRFASTRELLWSGRRVLQEITSAVAADRPAKPVPPSKKPATPTSPIDVPPVALAAAFGFARRPFSAVDPAACPYLGDPFASLRLRILECVGDSATTVLALTGAEGSGRGTLCRRVTAEMGTARLVLAVDLKVAAGGWTLPQRLCRAAGVEDSSAETGLDALVTRLGEERQQGRPPPLVVLYGVAATPPPTADLLKVIGAAFWTRSFKILMVGPTRLVDELAEAGLDYHGEHTPEIAVPPLDRLQLAAYLQSWIKVARPPNAPPILMTPDAVLLLTLRSEGALPRVNRIAENMLLLAAAERRRILTSWHAWTASDQERRAENNTPVALPQRPNHWPPTEVIDVIDSCRRSAGLPPWPREGVR
jgi:type II secretory pathway predicted ATPase ExeA